MIETEFEHERRLPTDRVDANPVHNEQTEESLNLNDEELKILVDQQKNCNTKKRQYQI